MDAPILAIDFGKKHIGFAVSDSNGQVATPLDVLHITEKMTVENMFESINEMISTYRVKSLLFGMPQAFTGAQGKSVERVKKFIDMVTKKVPLPYSTFDESFSTKEAQGIIVSTGSNFKKRKHEIDSIAASVFLQEYLNSSNLKNEKNI